MQKKIDEHDAELKRACPDHINDLVKMIKSDFEKAMPQSHRISVTARVSLLPPGFSKLSCYLLFPVLRETKRILATTGYDSPVVHSIWVETKYHGCIILCVSNRLEYKVSTNRGGVIMLFENKKLENELLIMGLVPLDTCCKSCKKEQDQMKFQRCQCCWKNLRLPVWYCCRGCQKEHWPEHKLICGRVRPVITDP